MIDIRRKNIKVRVDRREHPRLEFHCTAISSYVKNVIRVTDLSLGGLFFEVEDKSAFQPGKEIDLAIKFPTESNAIRVRSVVANVTERGVGCEFKNLSSENRAAIKHCFDTFKDTIPIS